MILWKRSEYWKSKKFLPRAPLTPEGATQLSSKKQVQI